MNESAPGTSNGGWLRRALGRGAEEGLGALVEGTLALLACAAAGVGIAGARWGWERHPLATALGGAGLLAFLGLGAWALAGGSVGGRKRALLASTAAGSLVVIVVWLVYVLMYCRCTVGGG